MKLTTVCYLCENNKMLMLYRNKKDNDINLGKWIGVGGKVNPKETPTKAALREFKEETGLTLKNINLRGIVMFNSDIYEEEMIFVYSSTSYSGTLKQCNEGTLSWIENDKVLNLPMWQGDHYFLPLLLDGSPFFELSLQYHEEKCTLISKI